MSYDATTHMYCLTCGYILNGCRGKTCPECGRGFSPTRPGSYATVRKRWYKAYYDKIIPVVLSCLGVMTAMVCAGGFVGMLVSVDSKNFEGCLGLPPSVVGLQPPRLVP